VDRWDARRDAAGVRTTGRVAPVRMLSRGSSIERAAASVRPRDPEPLYSLEAKSFVLCFGQPQVELGVAGRDPECLGTPGHVARLAAPFVLTFMRDVALSCVQIWSRRNHLVRGGLGFSRQAARLAEYRFVVIFTGGRTGRPPSFSFACLQAPACVVARALGRTRCDASPASYASMNSRGGRGVQLSDAICCRAVERPQHAMDCTGG